MARPKGQDSEQTVAMIRLAAVKCFAAGGVNQVSLRAVAREAELSPSSLSYYFASKQDLLVFCANYYRDKLLALTEALSTQLTCGDKEASLRATLTAGLSFCRAHAAEIRMMQGVWMAKQTDLVEHRDILGMLIGDTPAAAISKRFGVRDDIAKYLLYFGGMQLTYISLIDDETLVATTGQAGDAGRAIAIERLTRMMMPLVDQS